ncbi:MAG: ComF family protein [Sphingobacteriaceae bacterium]|nr:ComF family protein [Sphingobacteriaceae bacterium]
MIHAIKYQGNKELAIFLGELFAYDLLNDGVMSDIDVIIPIPLHSKKLKQRGYNQSEYLGKGVSNKLNKPLITDILLKAKETGTQTKLKKFERWENVGKVFEISNELLLENKHVLLVDDVITTGATLEAASQRLLQIKGLKLSIAALAFAPKR